MATPTFESNSVEHYRYGSSEIDVAPSTNICLEAHNAEVDETPHAGVCVDSELRTNIAVHEVNLPSVGVEGNTTSTILVKESSDLVNSDLNSECLDVGCNFYVLYCCSLNSYKSCSSFDKGSAFITALCEEIWLPESEKVGLPKISTTNRKKKFRRIHTPTKDKKSKESTINYSETVLKLKYFDHFVLIGIVHYLHLLIYCLTSYLVFLWPGILGPSLNTGQECTNSRPIFCEA